MIRMSLGGIDAQQDGEILGVVAGRHTAAEVAAAATDGITIELSAIITNVATRTAASYAIGIDLAGGSAAVGVGVRSESDDACKDAAAVEAAAVVDSTEG